MRKSPSEHDHQAALFQWAALQEKRWPELALMFAVPNQGRRSLYRGKKMKAEGMKAGVPDIVFPCPKGQYHGLFIEMKKEGGRPTKIQKSWLAALSRVGYKAVVCEGFEEAKKTLEDYLSPP